MGERKRKLKQKAVRAFDFPEDIATDEVCITVIGKSCVLLENHKGLLSYTDKSIKVKAMPAPVSVDGSELSIVYIDSTSLYISGKIENAHYE